MTDQASPNWINRSLAVFFGVVSGLLCRFVTDTEGSIARDIRSAMQSTGFLSDDLLIMALPTGLVFGVAAGVFAVWRMRWRAYWLIVLPVWCTATMWTAMISSIAVVVDENQLAIPFAVGSLVGCTSMMIPALIRRPALVWPVLAVLGMLAPTVASFLIGANFPRSNNAPFLVLFVVWQSLVLLAWAVASEREVPAD